MGCLNSEGKFSHWFGNIHLSGPCNAKCFFCIGQHMMKLDNYNVLDTWPLPGLDEFIKECQDKGIQEVNLTGTNTDPLLYKHSWLLKSYLLERMPSLVFGCRTNGIGLYNPYKPFDKYSVSIPSFNPTLYKIIMGTEYKLNWPRIKKLPNLKINVVLCPQTFQWDILNTIELLAHEGVERVNLREPYGQPHIGDPMQGRYPAAGKLFGNPTYKVKKTTFTYWDVHYTEVESVNLYASGRVSNTYPITKGYDDSGVVVGQDNLIVAGRLREQWQSLKQP